jgi:hypothetical protein
LVPGKKSTSRETAGTVVRRTPTDRKRDLGDEFS